MLRVVDKENDQVDASVAQQSLIYASHTHMKSTDDLVSTREAISPLCGSLALQ